MGIIRRYRTAWSRHHRSAGFGIHSPHAFAFVRNVLREACPYYAYKSLSHIHKQLSHAAVRPLLSLGEAKMLFRITNHFSPLRVLQIGASGYLDTASMTATSRRLRVTMHEPRLADQPLATHVLTALAPAVDLCPTLKQALDDYSTTLPHGQWPFVLVEDLSGGETDYDTLLAYLRPTVAGHAVVVMHHLSRNHLMRRLFDDVKAAMPHGQTFTNEKTAVVVASPKLQREDFFLWFHG